MNLIESLSSASRGWSDILAGKPEWESHFDLTAEGLNRAFLVYGIAVLVAIALVLLRLGFPAPGAMLPVLISHLIPLVVIVGTASLLKRFAGMPAAMANLVIPGLYIVALMKIVEGLAIVIGVPLAGAITAITAFLAFKLGRANSLPLPHAIGYALVIFLLLAGLPVALYMLVNASA